LSVSGTTQIRLRLSFLFINGHLRKVAIFPDPVTFSYNMVVAATMCICFFMLNISKTKKIILGCLIPFYLLTMLYSGTRGAYVLLPAALALLAILKFNKKIIAAVLAAGFVLVICNIHANLKRNHQTLSIGL
jgi:hypothetical protein